MIRFHSHAIVVISERNLRPEWVEATVMVPDWTAPDPDDSTAPFVLLLRRKGAF